MNMYGRFAAATVADGVSYSYTQYLFFGPSSALMERNYKQVVGTAPIGDGITQWIRSAPEFHTENISTPLRIEAIQSHSVLEEWELYASLKLQGKPVDLIYFPRGQHILQRPSERLVSEQGNVDWFRFWLQEYEDPNPSKCDQYKRWRIMRESLAQSKQDGDSQKPIDVHQHHSLREWLEFKLQLAAGAIQANVESGPAGSRIDSEDDAHALLPPENL